MSGEALLRGSRTQYADGSVTIPPPLHLEEILATFAQLNEDDRAAFLCVIAHDLTVDIRALLIDRPVHERDLDRIWQLNEFLHQITSSVNPRNRRSATGDTELVRAIVESAALHGLRAAIGRALATAAGSVNLSVLQAPARKEVRPMSEEDDLPPYADVERELLLFLFESGGGTHSRKAEDVYSPLADVFGLSREQRTRLRSDREEALWNNRVQWARRKLVEAGFMHREPRGVWRLTESGCQRAKSLTHHGRQ
jgi:Mrr N-terminal domain